MQPAFAILRVTMSNIKMPGVLTGSDGQQGRLARAVRRKSVRVGVLVLAVLLVCGAGWYAWYQRDHEVTAASPKEVTEAVDRTVLNPNYAGTEVALDNKLQQTDDPKVRAQIYLQKASIDLQQGKYQAVIADQTEAAKLDPSLDGVLARTTADAYLQVGDKASALKYYKKARQYYDSKPDSFSGKTYYENYVKSKIAGLEK